MKALGHSLLFTTLALIVAICTACGEKKQKLPTAEKVAELSETDRASAPPLYQLLYDSAFNPDLQALEQRTRILIWLRYMEFEAFQLQELKSLHERGKEVAEQVRKTEAEIYARYEANLAEAYENIRTLLVDGKPLDDESFNTAAASLLKNNDHVKRDREIYSTRMQSIATLLEEEQHFLQGLTPRQEMLFADVLFTLRSSLEPIHQPEAFRAMAGSTFTPGDPGLLLAGDYDENRQPMNLAGLWSDQASETISSPVLHEARLEMLLFLVMQEDAFGPAIDDALIALSKTASAEPVPNK